MTAVTISDVEDVLRAYLADHEDADEGAILTDWVLIAVTYLPEHDGDAHGYWHLSPARQAIHQTLGLIEQARHTHQVAATVSMVAGEDE